MAKTGLAWQTERVIYERFMDGESVASLKARFFYDDDGQVIEQAIRNEIKRREKRERHDKTNQEAT